MFGDLQGWAGTIDRGNAGTMRRKMKGKSSLIAKHVEGLAVRILSGRRVVFALIEKSSRLLAFERFKVKAHPVHREDG